VVKVASLAVLVLLAGCNLYNPSGKGSPETDQDWIEQGEAQLRALEFEAAGASFGRVLAHDSANTDAWIGYGKAVAARNLDMSLLLREVLESQREGRKPLWDTAFSLARKDSAYRGLIPVHRVLETWARLDSLGRATMPPRNRLERGLIAIAHSMLSLWDSNRDGRIDATGDALSISLFSKVGAVDTTGMGFIPLLTPDQFSVRRPDGTIDTTGAYDTLKVREYNALLDRTDAEFRTIANIASTDTAMSAIYSGLAGQNPQAIGMFEVANVVDDDLDGCADEEIIDYRDNDGDGLIDEDTRAGYVNPVATRAGDLAQVSKSDGVRGDRLADPRTGKGLVGVDSAGTLRWGDAYGHFEVFRPMWSRSPLENGLLAWKLLEPDARAALSERLRAIPTGAARAAEGCKVLGGCWCKVQRDVCAKGGCP